MSNMGIKRKIDQLGRLVIPSDMKRQIGLENGNEADIELQNDRIIVTNPCGMKSEMEITFKLNALKKLKETMPDDECIEEQIRTLEWVLNK